MKIDREALRRHLIEHHHWPQVAHYQATRDDLAGLHVLMHDPERSDEAVARIRALFAMPDPETTGDETA